LRSRGRFSSRHPVSSNGAYPPTQLRGTSPGNSCTKMSRFFVFVSSCFWRHCQRKSSRFARIDVLMLAQQLSLNPNGWSWSNGRSSANGSSRPESLLYLACLAAVVLGGSGPLAIEGLLAKRREITRPSMQTGGPNINADFGSSLLRTSARRERAGSLSIVTNIGVVAAPGVRRSITRQANSRVRPIERASSSPYVGDRGVTATAGRGHRETGSPCSS
jgi:hypothetical protein